MNDREFGYFLKKEESYQKFELFAQLFWENALEKFVPQNLREVNMKS
jgi:hypothetical protein